MYVKDNLLYINQNVRNKYVNAIKARLFTEEEGSSTIQ